VTPCIPYLPLSFSVRPRQGKVSAFDLPPYLEQKIETTGHVFRELD
jgi:hypothetical protein